MGRFVEIEKRRCRQFLAERDKAMDDRESLREINALLLAACRNLVDEWETSFEGQQTGFEGTPLEDAVQQARAAIAATEPRKEIR